MGLKYQLRPKVAPEFVPRNFDEKADARLSAALAARENEARSIAALLRPDVQDALPEETNPDALPGASEPEGRGDTPDKRADAGSETDQDAATPAAGVASAVVAAGTSTTGGTVQELKEQPEEQDSTRPPGVDENGEVVDAGALAEWQAEQEQAYFRDMQRQEEQNINVHCASEPRDDRAFYL